MVALQGMSLCALQRHVMNRGVQRTLVWIKVCDSSCLSAVVSAVSHLCCAVMSFWMPENRKKKVCAQQSSVHSGQAGPAALNNSNICFGHINNHNSSLWEHVTSINCVCQRNSKEKKIFRFCPSRKFPGAKEAIIWKMPAMLVPLPLLFWPEWEVLVCRAMWGLEHCSRSSLFSFISRWCRWDVSQPNERETVFFDSLMRTKHSHKVMKKRGEGY